MPDVHIQTTRCCRLSRTRHLQCPEWGYLKRHHADKSALLESFDDYRRQHQQPTLTELDEEKAYSLKLHSRGDHASGLIYACAYADFLDIDQDRYEIVAVTGNSMGWYISLAIAGALDAQKGLHLVNTMGGLMQERLIGGQLLIPWVDDDWRPDWDARARYLALADEICKSGEGRAYLSIDLGGMMVFGADTPGMAALNRGLPKKTIFPCGCSITRPSIRHCKSRCGRWQRKPWGQRCSAGQRFL